MSNWYSSPATAFTTVMPPVLTVQVGCVAVKVGTAGADAAVIVTLTDVAVQPAALRTVTVYDPGFTPLNVAVV